MNELSSALKRRFNTVVLPVPASQDEEVQIVTKRVGEQSRALQLPAEAPALQEVRRVVQIFRELRNGQTEDGKTVRVKSPSSTLSTAEAISVINSGMALAGHFGDGVLSASDVASGLLGAVIRTRCRTRWCGRNIWRPWSRKGRTGKTYIAPAESNCELCGSEYSP